MEQLIPHRVFLQVDTSTLTTTGQLIDKIEKCKGGHIMICHAADSGNFDSAKITDILTSVDLLHCGLNDHGGAPFENLQLCTFNWNFLNADASVPAVSWKPSLRFAVFDKALYDTVGGMDRGYEFAQNSLIDFAYRVMLHGGLTWHDPKFSVGMPQKSELTSYRDEARFILKHINQKGLRFYQLCMLLLRGRIVKSPLSIPQPTPRLAGFSFRFYTAVKSPMVSYSALIPTINRYDYIVQSIESLLALSFPPSEIIVVDQSPPLKRREDLYKPFQNRGVLKVIFLDKAGQSSARNAGLQAASHDWILLFEDDATAWPEMVNEHVRLLTRSAADVSTGVVVPPGANESFIPEYNRQYKLSDILTTGNAFLSKETAMADQGFDTAFDRGSGADDDFGRRLYLKGKRIVYNYKSIETHYKAPTGGMREHNAWWRNHSTLWGAYPPTTQLYVIRKFYSKRFWVFLIMLLVFKAKKRYSWPSYLLLLILLPYKVSKSWRESTLLLKR